MHDTLHAPRRACTRVLLALAACSTLAVVKSAPLRGPLAPGVIPGLLREVYVGRRTGTLVFGRDAERVGFRFLDGSIVHGEASAPSRQLGELMVAEGMLSAADLARARGLVAPPGKRLGQVLEDLGILSYNEVVDALAVHVRELLLEVFTWTRGHYGFVEGGHRPPHHDITLRLPTGEMILVAVRRLRDPLAVSRALGDTSRVPAASTDPLLRFQKISLTPADAYVLSRVDGALSARAVIDLAPVPAFDAERSLLGLLCTGMLEYTPAPAAEEPPPPVEVLRAEILQRHRDRVTTTHFAVLELDRSATEEDARAALLRLARRFHPDIHHREGLTDLRSEIEGVFHRIGLAHKVLSDAQARTEYETALMVDALGREAAPEGPRVPETAPGDPDAPSAEDALRAAEDAFGAGQYWDAIERAREALPGLRGLARRRARVILATCCLRNPHWRKQAEDELHAAVREDPENAEAWFLLGGLYKEAGLPARAEKMYRRTLEVRPRHPGARAELAAMAAAQPGRGGLLRRLMQ